MNLLLAATLTLLSVSNFVRVVRTSDEHLFSRRTEPVCPCHDQTNTFVRTTYGEVECHTNTYNVFQATFRHDGMDETINCCSNMIPWCATNHIIHVDQLAEPGQ